MTYVITGDELRQRRQAKSLSQRDLADMLGVRPQSVSQWETGATTPSWQQAQKLEEIFEGVTPEASGRIDRLESAVKALADELAQLTEMIKRLGGSFPPGE